MSTLQVRSSLRPKSLRAQKLKEAKELKKLKEEIGRTGGTGSTESKVCIENKEIKGM